MNIENLLSSKEAAKLGNLLEEANAVESLCKNFKTLKGYKLKSTEVGELVGERLAIKNVCNLLDGFAKKDLFESADIDYQQDGYFSISVTPKSTPQLYLSFTVMSRDHGDGTTLLLAAKEDVLGNFNKSEQSTFKATALNAVDMLRHAGLIYHGADVDTGHGMAAIFDSAHERDLLCFSVLLLKALKVEDKEVTLDPQKAKSAITQLQRKHITWKPAHSPVVGGKGTPALGA